MRPEVIAFFISEDIRVNNGIILEMIGEINELDPELEELIVRFQRDRDGLAREFNVDKLELKFNQHAPEEDRIQLLGYKKDPRSRGMTFKIIPTGSIATVIKRLRDEEERFRKRDVHENKGLVLEYQMESDIIPLMQTFPDLLSFGFDLKDPLLTKNPEFVKWYTTNIKVPFEKATGFKMKRHEVSAVFNKIIATKDKKLFWNTDDKLVTIIRKLIKPIDTADVKTPTGPLRAGKAADKEFGYGRIQTIQRGIERRNAKLDQS